MFLEALRRVHKPEHATSPVNELPADEIYFGQTPAMRLVRQRIEKVANSDVPLLIEGGNGTGKEVLARLVHERSIWSKGKFVKVNCAAIPGTLMESELFGYEKGAFTGANTAKPGRVELADGGTLFLDEIGELALGLQAKLLQFLQDWQFSRIGGEEEKRVHTRLICATSRQLEKEVQAGHFRIDLFYRINVIHIKLPLLRDRAVDVTTLAEHFLELYGVRFQQTAPSLPIEMMRLLQRADWPGNIRELENCMARCVILGPQEALETYLRAAANRKTLENDTQTTEVSFKRRVAEAGKDLERDVILKTLERHNWNRRKTAQDLKISYRTLLYKLRDAGLHSTRQRQVTYPTRAKSAAVGNTTTD